MPKPDNFNEALESFTNYKERLDAYFLANDIAKDKQSANLLSALGPKVYGILRSLTAPDLPTTKTYSQLCELLTTHFCPKPLEIMERYKFHKRDQQQSESISEFIAAIKKLSEHCNFGDALLVTLRDRFVCGLKDVNTQKRLLQERNLTFDIATNMALAMETATKDAAEIHGESLHAIKSYNSRKHVAKDTKPKHQQCASCGKTNHARTECFFREATCKKCGKSGHIQSVCRSKGGTNQKHQISKKRTEHSKFRQKPDNVHSLEDEFGLEVYNMNNTGSPKFTSTISIDDTDVKMEIDTGSALSIMSIADYKEIFNKPPQVHSTDVKLRTYTGEIIKPLGYVDTKVLTAEQSEPETLRLFIVNKGSNPIMGREWLLKMKINWQDVKSVTLDQKPTIQQIKSEFPDLFSPGIGTIKDMTANLQLKEEARPKFLKARTVPYALKEKIEKELDNLEKQGILTKTTHSDWATPIVPVLKKSGDIRLCGDFKVTINPVLDAEQYTLPRVEDMFANIEHGELFSKIDIRQAYHQLQLDDNSKKITTINTHKGLYSYNRLVFGITSAPAIWQRKMDQILQGLPCQCNQDDIIVTGKDNEEHTKNLRAVLQRLQDYGLRANIDKCAFFQENIVFCGIKISSKGLHKTDEKIQAVVNAPTPQSKSQLRSFLGMVNYYHKWLQNIAQIAKPLYDLLQANVDFKWSNACSKSFMQIKKLIASEEVLIKYNPDLPITLASDASPHGIGCVLSHITNDGNERPIAYGSRTLSKAEQKYSQLDKEALAIVWSVKKFYNYLCGRKFTLITDHKPLQYIFDPKKGIPVMSLARQQRYAIFLSGFDYSIQYRSSKANANADGLSRLPLPSSHPSQEEETDIFYTEIMSTLPINATTIAKESRVDPILSKVINYVKTDEWPNEVTEELKPFVSKRYELSVQQDCLFWGYRVIPPMKLHKRILSTIHTGHLGIVKMKTLARNYFWWQTLDKNIEAITRECEGCANSQQDPSLSPLHPWNWPNKPWIRLHIDYAGPFMGHMFLVAVDAHTKWLEVIPTQDTTSSNTINILSSLFARFGLPQQLVSDNGPQFTSDEFKAFVRSNAIKHTFTAPYHPATNGLAERAVKTFKNSMKAAKNDKGNMQTKLARFLFAYRNAPHSTTNESPAFLMFGRTLRSHLDLLRPNIESSVTGKQQSQVDKHSQSNLRTFKVGDSVLVRDYRRGQQWKQGTILSSSGPLMYHVETGPNAIWRRHANQIVHTHIQPKTSASAVEEPHSHIPVTDSIIRQDPELTTSASPDTAIHPYSTNSGLLENTPTPPVELSGSPQVQSNPDSPATPGKQTPTPTRIPYTTTRGRVVRKPTRYTY